MDNENETLGSRNMQNLGANCAFVQDLAHVMLLHLPTFSVTHRLDSMCRNLCLLETREDCVVSPAIQSSLGKN